MNRLLNLDSQGFMWDHFGDLDRLNKRRVLTQVARSNQSKFQAAKSRPSTQAFRVPNASILSGSLKIIFLREAKCRAQCWSTMRDCSETLPKVLAATQTQFFIEESKRGKNQRRRSTP
jgi:hypothetical protein